MTKLEKGAKRGNFKYFLILWTKTLYETYDSHGYEETTPVNVPEIYGFTEEEKEDFLNKINHYIETGVYYLAVQGSIPNIKRTVSIEI